MKILHVDETFHPTFGYQVNSLAKYQRMQGHEVYIITTPVDKLRSVFKFSSDNGHLVEYDKQYEDNTGVKIIRMPVKGFVSNRAIFTKELFYRIDEIRPDVVMLHQIETYASIVFVLKGYHKKYPTISDSHMLKMASKNKFAVLFNIGFRILIKNKLIKNKIPVIRTQDDDYVNKILHIPANLTPFISFGSDLTMFHRDSEKKNKFREENNIPLNAFVITYTGKLNESKGGMLLAKAFKEKIESKNDRDVVMVVVGNTFQDEYGKSVEQEFCNSQNHLIRFETQKYIDLPQFYQASDLCVFAKQCSLSFYDAQACGVPVVMEDNNINIDRVKYGNGMVFKSGDVDDFIEKIKLFVDMEENEYKIYSNNSEKFILDNYGYDKIAEKYTKIMQDKIKEFKSDK